MNKDAHITASEYYKLLVAEYKKASPLWVTADWEHEVEDRGKPVYQNGSPLICRGFDAHDFDGRCEVCFEAEFSAQAAKNFSRDALGFARAGQWEDAARRAELAKAEEALYRDPIVWSTFHDVAVRARETSKTRN